MIEHRSAEHAYLMSGSNLEMDRVFLKEFRFLFYVHDYLQSFTIMNKLRFRKMLRNYKISDQIWFYALQKQESLLERELAAITLQQLIRGRAIQTQMYEGKEKRKELIEELRSTHALLEDDIAEKRRQKQLILSTQNRHVELLHRVSSVQIFLYVPIWMQINQFALRHARSCS